MADGDESRTRRPSDVPTRDGSAAESPVNAATPSFAPFFMVIEDGASAEYHHPHVRYIFSDDDPEPLTSAILHSLEASDGSSSAAVNDERFLIVDVGDSGQDVTAAKSLSPDWQISSVKLNAAPTFGDSAGSVAGEAKLMLRVGGVESYAAQGKEHDDTANALQQAMAAGGGNQSQNLHSALEALSLQYESELEALKAWSSSEVSAIYGGGPG